jgi:hypothetical protein
LYIFLNLISTLKWRDRLWTARALSRLSRLIIGALISEDVFVCLYSNGAVAVAGERKSERWRERSVFELLCACMHAVLRGWELLR